MVSSIERFHCIQDSQLGQNGVLYREVPRFHCIQDNQLGQNGVLYREVPLYSNSVTAAPSLALCADLCTCHALYAYEPQQEDELQLEPDDIIYVTEKMSDDWWKGELNGQLGIFPATYVEEHGSPSPDNEGGDYAFGLS